MASTFSPILRIELIGTGDQSGTWGNTTNINLGTLIEQAIAGTTAIDVTVGNVTLTNFNGTTDEARCMAIRVSGTPGTSRNIIAPAVSKIYVIANGSDAAIVLKTSTSTGLTVPVGEVYLAYFDPTVGVADFRLVGRASSSANTANTLVLRDGSGNFAAGTITASLTGNVTGNLNGNLTAAAPTAATQTAGDNSTKVATTAYVKTATDNLNLGTISTQNANNVAITGGTLNVGSAATGVRPLQVSGGTSAESTLYVSDGLADNRIWNFLVSCTSGAASGFQIRKLNDAGNLATPAFVIDSSLNGTIIGSMTAASFSGAGTGLTGTANSLNAGLGVNQSYQNVTGSRSFSTTYTNSTGKPIFVSVLAGGNSTLRAFVDGAEIQRCVFTTTNTNTNVAFIVPNGATYSVTSSAGGLLLWTELR